MGQKASKTESEKIIEEQIEQENNDLTLGMGDLTIINHVDKNKIFGDINRDTHVRYNSWLYEKRKNEQIYTVKNEEDSVKRMTYEKEKNKMSNEDNCVKSQDDYLVGMDYEEDEIVRKIKQNNKKITFVDEVKLPYCNHILSKGINAGNACGRRCKNGSDKCAGHSNIADRIKKVEYLKNTFGEIVDKDVTPTHCDHIIRQGTKVGLICGRPCGINSSKCIGHEHMYANGRTNKFIGPKKCTHVFYLSDGEKTCSVTLQNGEDYCNYHKHIHNDQYRLGKF